MRKGFLLFKLVLPLLLLLATVVRANDSAVVGEGGRVRFLKGEHKSVQMVRETVRIDLYSKYYDVAATFVFHNNGAAVSVRMGFPESGGGGIDPLAYRKQSAFLSFATWVDGQQVETRREIASASEDEESYQAFWVKTVSFGADQTRTVRVRYRSPVGQHLDSVTVRGEMRPVTWRSASYNFTGGNWRGKVEESVLKVVSHLAVETVFKIEPKLSRSGRTFTLTRRNWEAQESVFVRFRPPREYGPVVSEHVDLAISQDL